MMIAPQVYAKRLENAGYLQLIKERNRLISYIKEFEDMEIADDRSGFGWEIHPSPVVVYQCYLEYLGELCKLMSQKYNQKYVWGRQKLKDELGEYKGYQYRIYYDAEENLFMTEVIGITDSISAHAETLEDVLQHIEDNIDLYLEMP